MHGAYTSWTPRRLQVALVSFMLLSGVLIASPGAGRAQDVVTYDDDVFPLVFEAPGCNVCHSSDLVGGARFGAPVGVDYDTFALATEGTNAFRAVVRVLVGDMPPSGALTQELMNLMAAWQGAGFPENQAAGELMAAAGVSGDFNVPELSRVTLDGTSSRASDGTLPAIFSWVQTDGPAVILNDPQSAAPSFIAPNVDTVTTLVFELIVVDGGETDTDTVSINVFDVVQPVDVVTYDDDVFPMVFAPECNVCHSSDLVGDARFGAPVGVDYDTFALATQGANEILAVDEVVAGTMPPSGALTQELIDLMVAWQGAGFPENPSSVAPAGELMAAAGVSGDFNVPEFSRVTLDGTSSRASDGTLPALFSWVQTDGPAVILNDSQSAAPSFIAPDVDTVTTLVFELIVVDGGETDTATVSLDVFDVAQPFSEGADNGNGGCAMNPGASFDPVLVGLVGFSLAFLGWQRVRKRTRP